VVRSLEAEGEPLPLLLWTLAEELRAMVATASGERTRRYAAPEMARATAALARLHEAGSFDRELLRAHRIDRMIKGVEPGDPWEGVIELALGLAARPVLEQAA
jgi:DNA polymerase-3 subunit delta